MAERDELAELVNGRPLPSNGLRTVGAIYERGAAYERADAILARWRLVPVDAPDLQCPEADDDGTLCRLVRGHDGPHDARQTRIVHHGDGTYSIVPVQEPWMWPSGTTLPTDHPGAEVPGYDEWAAQHRAAGEL